MPSESSSSPKGQKYMCEPKVFNLLHSTWKLKKYNYTKVPYGIYKIKSSCIFNQNQINSREMLLRVLKNISLFSGTIERVNVKHNYDQTITYKDRTRFKFDKEASGRFSNEDWVTVINFLIYVCFPFCYLEWYILASFQ
jgi:hypothetical protein